MAKRIWEGRQTVSGLRTRYVPKSRIGHGVISLAPWMDIVLIVVFFALLQGKFVIRPGVVVELPGAEVRGGTQDGLTAVVLSLGEGDRREEFVIFDDDRFRSNDAEQMHRLRTALGKKVRTRPGAPLIVMADQRVAHGTLVKLYDMARRLGVEEVNVATREARGVMPVAESKDEE